MRNGGCPIVGIGASAGGLDALQRFLGAVPPDSGAAFVLVQHLAPGYPSTTADILHRSTTMPVVQAEDGMRVEAGHVYVIPPNTYLTVSNRVLHLGEPVLHRGMRMPIDAFLRSLAEDCREKGIAIILSGTGTDGTLGVKAIKSHGGMVMAEDPEEAQYDGMPRSAIATGLVDYVAAVEALPEALAAYLDHAYVRNGGVVEPKADEAGHLRSILAMLRSRMNHDFRAYKQGTLLRRIARRMGLRHIDSLGEYLAFLREDPDEVTKLFKDLLIGVTGFFRDAWAFEALADEAVAEIVAGKSTDEPIRVWVPGCASGEEAYSIVILLLEALEAARKHCPLQVFATDIDEEALDAGRTGIYEENIVADVTPARLERFFRKEDHSYRVTKSVRECVTFAVQDLVRDPPFSRLNLISSRNLLIYFEPEVQRRVLELFHFALDQSGYLFLGTAEGIGQQRHLFEPVEKKARVYRRRDGVAPAFAGFPIFPSGEAAAIAVGAGPRSSHLETTRIGELAQQQLLRDYAPAAVVVGRGREVIYYFGSTGAYLDQPGGAPTRELVALARQGLRTKLQGALMEAARDGRRVVVDDARVIRDGHYVPVRLAVERLGVPGADDEFLLVSFVDRPESQVEATLSEEDHGGANRDSLVQELERELLVTREDLQSTIEEQETANEELKAAHEEVMSVNEELQSTNEELETAKEELQSMNEELSTVNNQLKSKVEELESINDDLANLLGSTDIPTLFLDTGLCIKRFTPATKRLFNLIVTDIGRPLSDISRNFDDDTLLDDIQQVLERLTPIERETSDGDSRYYLRRALPYRTRDGGVDGVVVTFVDISARKRAEEQIQRLATVVRDSNDAITVQDLDGRIIAWNQGAQRMYRWSEHEAIGMSIRDLVPEDRRAAALAMHEDLVAGKTVESFETQRLTRDGRILDVWLTVTLLVDEAGVPFAIATTERDVTERRRVEEALRVSEANMRSYLEATPDALIISDEHGAITFANAQTVHLFGYSHDELIGMQVEELMPERFRAKHVEHRRVFVDQPVARGMGAGLELFGRARDGREFPVEVSLSPIETPEGPRVSASVRDVSERKRAESALREQTHLANSLVETAQAIVLLMDPDGRMIKVNPYFEQLTGYTAEEVEGADWFTMFLPEADRMRVRALFDKVVRVGVNPGHTNPIVCKDGTVHQIEWRAKTLLDGAGRIVGLLSIGHDVTEKLAVENAMQEAKAQAERANAAKSRFLASASHDLRQPLQTISLLNEVLEKRLDDPELKKILVNQREALDVIDGLLKAYLDITRLEAGIVRPAFRDFCVGELLEQLRTEFQPHCESNGLVLRIVPSSVAIRSDPALLTQIMHNLVANAIRHTPPPGRVLIGCRRRGTHVRLEVWDTGPGIPGDQLGKIFEEFYQLDNPARGGRAGIGLGLTIVERTARLLGHTVDVRSAPGKGSVFAVVVPVTRRISQPAPVDVPDASAEPFTSSTLVLIVDDDPAIVAALEMFLSAWGLRISTASDGAQALAHLEGGVEPPDLVICDFRLPGGQTGLEIIEALRDAAGRPLPAILMTGDTAAERLREAEAADCRLLLKPAREENLIPLIRELLG